MERQEKYKGFQWQQSVLSAWVSSQQPVHRSSRAQWPQPRGTVVDILQLLSQKFSITRTPTSHAWATVAIAHQCMQGSSSSSRHASSCGKAVVSVTGTVTAGWGNDSWLSGAIMLCFCAENSIHWQTRRWLEFRQKSNPFAWHRPQILVGEDTTKSSKVLFDLNVDSDFQVNINTLSSTRNQEKREKQAR